MNIVDLPQLVLRNIFECLPYEEAAKLREVCRTFDDVGQQVLNSGFLKAVRAHQTSFRRIKAQLPRRESERRNHSLARHADVLTCIETRVSMLTMTFNKYIDMQLCCFIPGKILDEIFRLLRMVHSTQRPLRPHEVLQELRDISSMAIEHFDEKISPALKQKAESNSISRASNSSPVMTGTIHFPSVMSGNYCAMRRMRVIPENLLKSNDDIEGNGVHGLWSLKQQLRQKKLLRTCNRTVKRLRTQNQYLMLKHRLMSNAQRDLKKRVQQAAHDIAEMKNQLNDTKKLLQDMDARSRDISPNKRELNSTNDDDETAGASSSMPVSSDVSANKDANGKTKSAAAAAAAAPADNDEQQKPGCSKNLRKRTRADNRAAKGNNEISKKRSHTVAVRSPIATRYKQAMLNNSKKM